MKKSLTLCDHKCPIHNTCARYLEGLDRRNTNHYDPNPYEADKKKCSFFEPLTDDDFIDKMFNRN